MCQNHRLFALLAVLGSLALSACAPPSNQLSLTSEGSPPSLGFAGFSAGPL